MGLFDKIKSILFEDDEIDEIPVYSKEDVVSKESKKEEVKEEKEEIIFEENDNSSRFKNMKRDFDFSFDEDEVLDEIKPISSSVEEIDKTEVIVKKDEEKAEKKDVFLSFDEDEFERLNARINRNEEKSRREARSASRELKKDEDPMVIARRANNNFSSTTPTVDTKDVLRNDSDRYKIHTGRDVKKPFTPSPVISPVYGILDKNYTKDSIVDKKDGMKRERVKPIKQEVVLESELKRQEEKNKEETKQESKDINIDLVRKKAYGVLEENVAKIEEDQAVGKKSKVVLTTVGEQEDLVEFQEKFGDDLVDDAMMAVAKYNTPEIEEKENIEDKVEEDLNKTKIQEYDNTAKEIKVEKKDKKSKILDDLEKTSTLQILDDIEKELSSIKPISKSYQDEEIEETSNLDDTLENDLFNLIDSMYEQGEEDDDE